MMLFLYGDRLDVFLPRCSDFVFLWFVGWCYVVRHGLIILISGFVVLYKTWYHEGCRY